MHQADAPEPINCTSLTYSALFPAAQADSYYPQKTRLQQIRQSGFEFLAHSKQALHGFGEWWGLGRGELRQAGVGVLIGDQAGRLSERSEFGQTPNQHANAGESGKAGPPPFPPTQAPPLAESPLTT